LGMDLLRLALERAGTAAEAVEVITDLLERHGQGGNCAVHREFRYDNGFAIADPKEAWILETCGRHWVVRRVEAPDAISNIASTGSRFDSASEGAFAQFRAHGWLAADDPDDFGRAVTDPDRTLASNGGGRCSRARELLQALREPVTPADLMTILRDHGPDPSWRPDDLARPSTLCMHAGGAQARLSQTTGAMISVLHPQQATHFLTGSAAPCTNLFRPAWVDALAEGFAPAPTDTADADSLFWRHERRHRQALRDLPAAGSAIAAQRDAYESAIVDAALAMQDAPASFRQDFGASAFRLAEELLDQWSDTWAALPEQAGQDADWRAEWARVDARSGLANPD
ncbi:MAG TPA: C69 family dipeptidase, partial [Pseudomonadales bacterium]|nr:C69 family dipeptidase [Pseudomonadales bacterium]